MTVDPRHFLINSDYPLDKIAGSTTGSVTIAGSGGMSTITVPHIFGVAPLCVLKWSTTSDFSISYEACSSNYVAGYMVSSYADSSNIYISSANYNASSGTIYYRVYYHIPYDADIDVAPTANNFDKFVINTDYNYCKVYLEGRTTSNGQVITHNLGYYPQVEAWIIRSGKTYHVMFGESDASPWHAVLTTTTVTFSSTTTTDRFYYKVYADEN